MPRNGVTNSVFIMQLTKEQLTDAHEQGLSISTRNGNIKIVAILNDVYGVNHCDTNSKLVKWWMFENFERNEAKIEQHKPNIDLSILKEGEIYYLKRTMYHYMFKFRHLTPKAIIWDSNILLRDSEIYNGSGGIKLNYVTELRLPTESELELFYSKFPDLKPKPKYNGRAVKCDTVEQILWYCKHKDLEITKSRAIELLNDYKNNLGVENNRVYSINYAKDMNIEIISFSDYCKENGITEPKWIQGFEVGKDYNDVVMVSDDDINYVVGRLIKVVDNDNYPFHLDNEEYYKHCRYLNKNEINEIKFSN